MRWVTVFLLTLPLCSALTVTPTNLDRGKIVVMNDLETNASYKVIEANEVNTFQLKSKEKKVINVVSEEVEVQEVQQGSNIINSFKIKKKKDEKKIFPYILMPLSTVILLIYLMFSKNIYKEK